MENKIKEHIDKLLKKRLKESVDGELDKITNESDVPIDQKEEKRLKDQIRKNIKEKLDKEYEYSAWLDKVLSHNLGDSYFPSNQDEEDLFQLLNLEVLYKRTFKSACDDGHPIIVELIINTSEPILEILDDEPLLTKELFELAKWMHSYYFCSFGEAMFGIMPKTWKISKIF